MKSFLICAVLTVSSFSYAKNWVPKYKQVKLSSLDESEIQNNFVSAKISNRPTKSYFSKADEVISIDSALSKSETIRKKSISSEKKRILKGKQSVLVASPLERLYLKKTRGRVFVKKLKRETLKLKQKAVPVLVKVMKSSDFPDDKRWIATYMLGRIMGKKAAPYISKFSSHPNWMLRLASLKVLLHLKQKKYKGIYARLLEDKSLIVRHQALENIREMKIAALAPYIWKMLYNKNNYVGKEGKRSRTKIIKNAILAMGDLGFKKAAKPMVKMLQKSKYQDIHEELDRALSKVFKKSSPKGAMTVKAHFWSKEALKNISI